MRRCIALLLLVLSILAAPKSPLAGAWNMFSASYFQMLSEYYSILKDTHYISNSSSITDHTDATKLGSYAWVRAQIGSENRKVYFPARSTPYIFPDDYTTSTYTEISLLPGAIISIPTGKTLTISKFDAASAGDRQCFSGVGSVAFADGAVSWINSAWFPNGDADAGALFAVGNIPIWIKADGTAAVNGLSISVPDATTEVKGISELATDAEAQAKTATDKVLTASNLAALGASDSSAGLIEIATTGEVNAAASSSLAVTPATLAKAQASGVASLDASSKVVQDPASATATPGAGKIPIADGSGKLDGWVTAYTEIMASPGDIGGTTPGKVHATQFYLGSNRVLTEISTGNLLVGSFAGGVSPELGIGSYNTLLGYMALHGGTINATIANNTLIGYQAGYANGSSFASNTGIGMHALYSNSGIGNIAVGISAGKSLSGNSSVAIGNNAICAYGGVSSSENVVVGHSSLYPSGVSPITGGYNVAIGNSIGGEVTSAEYNTMVGHKAGDVLTSGKNNVLIGAKAGDSLTSGTGNIIIGYEQDVSSATVNNEINIGGLIYGDNDTATAGISIAAPLAKWHTVGTGANRMMTSAIGKGGWTEGVAEAAADITASASVTIQVDIPTNAKIRGCQLRVDAALAAGELWDAKFNDGSDVETITTAAAVAKNTKINFFSSLTTDAETDIVITKNGGGSFTAQGTIRAVVYYEYLYAMGDAA